MAKQLKIPRLAPEHLFFLPKLVKLQAMSPHPFLQVTADLGPGEGSGVHVQHSEQRGERLFIHRFEGRHFQSGYIRYPKTEEMAPETAQNAPRKTLIKKITHTARYFLEVDETWSLVKFSRGSCKMRFWKVDKSHPTTQNTQVLSPERAPMRGPPLISQPFLLIPNKHYCTLFLNEFYTTKPGLFIFKHG